MATFCRATQSDGLEAPPISKPDPNQALNSSESGSESRISSCLIDKGPMRRGDLSGHGESVDSSKWDESKLTSIGKWENSRNLVMLEKML